MPSYLVKPAAPTWRPNSAPDGCRFFAAFGQFGESRPRNYVTSVAGTVVGSPTWIYGPYGPQLDGFSTSNYLTFDAMPQFLNVGTFPFWIACLFVNTGVSDAFLVGSTSLSSATPTVAVRINSNNNVGQVRYEATGDAVPQGLALSSVGAATCNDGLPHVMLGISYSASNHVLYFDGVSLATSAATITTGTTTAFTVGMKRTTTNSSPLSSGSVIVAAAGSNASPDPVALTNDWLTGRFSAVRPRQSR